QWTSLDAQSTAAKAQPPVPMNRPLIEKAPSYPSSSLHAKNWDKLEAEIKRDEKENKDDMGDANAIFQRLYQDSDENTRRAMNKSMYESGGTCLNMNWEEVSKGRVTCEPPDVSLFIYLFNMSLIISNLFYSFRVWNGKNMIRRYDP
ncbi:unnamed protein product, partial [Rotaria sordida]